MGKVKKPRKRSEGEQILGITRSGTVITEELAEQMAEEIERNPPDPSTLKRRHVGRPSLGPAGHPPRVSFRVPADLFGPGPTRKAARSAISRGRPLTSTSIPSPRPRPRGVPT